MIKVEMNGNFSKFVFDLRYNMMLPSGIPVEGKRNI